MRIDYLHRRVMRDAQTLYAVLENVVPAQLPTEYSGRAINLQSFLNRVNRETEPLRIWHDIIHPDVGLMADRDIPNSEGSLHYMGEWLPRSYVKTTGHDADILIHWIVPQNGRRVTYTPATWRARRFTLWTYLMHEIVHRHQGAMGTEARESRVYHPQTTDLHLKEERMYLGDYDEIEAHAHDVALEMLAWYPDLSFTAAMAEVRASRYPKNSYATYPIYLRAFTDPKHPAFRVFQKKIRAWYQMMSKDRQTYIEMSLCPH